MLNVTLTSIAVALTPITIKAEMLALETSPAYLIISIGLFICSLILLVIPGKGCFTRLIKSILYLGLIAISGFSAYTLLKRSPVRVLLHAHPSGGGFLLPVHHIVAATVFSSLLTLHIAQITLSDWVAYTTIGANIMTIITSLVGLAKQLDAK
jgi:hypothetical protein